MALLKKEHIGSTLDQFLAEEGLLEHTQTVALKRIIAYRLCDILAEENITQAELARRMGTSKAAISRLLDPNVSSITLSTLTKAVRALGKNITLLID